MRQRVPIPFGVQEYQHRHRGAGSQVAINMMPAGQAMGAKGPILMQRVEGFGTPLVEIASEISVPTPPHKPYGGVSVTTYYYNLRGMRAMGSYLYFILDNELYRVDASGSVSIGIGNISGTGLCWMEHNGVQLVIVDDLGGGYVYDSALDTFAAISDPDYPGASWVQFMDQYFVFGSLASSTFFISALADPTSYDALEIATAETLPDVLVSGLRDHRDLLLFGAETVEVWYNEGGADFPFGRAPDGCIEVGCFAKHGPARLDNSTVFPAVERGGRSIRRLEGRTPIRISTPAMDDELDSYGTVSDAYSMTWQLAGHSYYALTFPTEGRTWVYDAASRLWHRRRSANMDAWRCGHVEPFNGRVYGMDLSSLVIAPFDRDSHGDFDSTAIPWEIVTAPIAADRRATSVLRVELEVDAGAMGYTEQEIQGYDEPLVFLSWSDDDGRTWSNELARSMGRHGQYARKLEWHNLGMTETGRVFRIRGGGFAPAAIISATAEIEVGG